MIQITQANGETTTSASDIGVMAVNYFSELFTSSPFIFRRHFFANIQDNISKLDDQSFGCLPTSDEVWEAIKQLSPTSSPGNDGFTGYFYQSCWEIIHDDVMAFVLDFFKGAYIQRDINITTLVLIPKTTAPRQLGDFRPIILENFCGKII